MCEIPFRDVFIALPVFERHDVYREHQGVWRELVRLGMPATHGEAAPFLFASDGETLIHARLPHTSLRAPLSGSNLTFDPQMEAYSPDSWAYLPPAWMAGFSRV